MVVVFPLVPDTIAIRLLASNLDSAPGSSLSITVPRIDAPDPRPASRDATAAARPIQVAAVSRTRAAGRSQASGPTRGESGRG